MNLAVNVRGAFDPQTGEIRWGAIPKNGALWSRLVG
jgi:hypothetical protein